MPYIMHQNSYSDDIWNLYKNTSSLLELNMYTTNHGTND